MENNDHSALIDQLMALPEEELDAFIEQLHVEGKLTWQLLKQLKDGTILSLPIGSPQLEPCHHVLQKVLALVTNDPIRTAWAKWGLSLVQMKSDQPHKSLPINQSAIDSFIEADQWENAGILIANQIGYFLRLGQLKEGELFAQHYESDVLSHPFATVLSRFYWHWGAVKIHQHNPQDALPLYLQAESYIHALRQLDQERFWLDLASVYLENGQYSKAESGFQASLAYFETQEGTQGNTVGIILYRLAQLYQRTGRLAQALACADRAVLIMSPLGTKFSDYVYAILLLGEMLLHVGDYQATLETLAIVDETTQVIAQAFAALQRGMAYHGLGVHFLLHAKTELKRCIALFGQQHSQSAYLAQHQLARVLLSEYRAHENEVIWQEGMDLLLQSQEALPPQTAQQAETQLLLAEYALQKGDVMACERWLAETAVIAQQLPHLQITFTYLQGAIAQCNGDLTQAKEHFAHAWQLSYRIRNTLPQTSLRVSFTAQLEHIQEQLLEAAWQTADWQSFFQWSDALRAHALHESLAEDSGLAKADEETRQRFLAQQAAYYFACRQLQQDSPVEQPASTIQEPALRQQIREQYKTLQAMRTEFTAPFTPISISRLAESLPKQTCCLLYQRLGNQLVALIVDNTGLCVHQALPTEWETIQAALHDFVIDGFDQFQYDIRQLGFYDFIDQKLSTHLSQSQQTLQQLYQHLWQPLASSLNNYNEIVIVVDDTLHYLPFCALYTGQYYLLDQHIVSYAPSAMSYIHASQKAKNRIYGEQVALVAYKGVGEEALAGVIKEVEDIQQTCYPQAMLILNEQATPEALRRAAPDLALLHIATHGTTRPNAPLRSALTLSSTDGHKHPFSVYDAAQLNLHQTDMVVLSGCSTGQLISRGGERLGLSWGFMQAGAYAVLANLLPVLDYFTPRLMTRFYQTYQDLPHKAHALHQTQRWTRQQGENATRPEEQLLQHPYLWSPFGFYGFAGTLTHATTP